MASSDIFEIEIFGKSSHGARPHEGVDAILITSMAVNSLNHIVSRRIEPLHPVVISLGTIQGGAASNIICEHVKVTGTVRSVNKEIRNKIPKMMEESIRGISKSMGATYKKPMGETYKIRSALRNLSGDSKGRHHMEDTTHKWRTPDLMN